MGRWDEGMFMLLPRREQRSQAKEKQKEDLQPL